MNLNKLNQKNFLKTMVAIFGLFYFFSVLACAEKLSLPEKFEVFKIAVIGSNITDDNEIVDEDYGEEHSLNKFTVDKLCACGLGKKLSEYDVANVDNDLKNEEIELYKNYAVRLPNNSIIMNDSPVVFSFYQVKDYNEANRILPECQFAICPFYANLNERGDDLNKRLTKLRDFVKWYNEMCDVRFLYYMDNIENLDDSNSYRYEIGDKCKYLYTLTSILQQDVISNELSTIKSEGYRQCIDSFCYWHKERAKEFETVMKKKILKIEHRFEILKKNKAMEEIIFFDERETEEKRFENDGVVDEENFDRKGERAEEERIVSESAGLLEDIARSYFEKYFFESNECKKILMKSLEEYSAQSIKDIIKNYIVCNCGKIVITLEVTGHFKCASKIGICDKARGKLWNGIETVYNDIFNDSLVRKKIYELILSLLLNKKDVGSNMNALMMSLAKVLD